jgi:uncharacterized membrane protein
MSINEENMSFTFNDVNDYDNNEEVDLSFFLNKDEFYHDNNLVMDDFNVSLITNYQVNYTVKELLLICDYYGFSKEIKANKCNKDEIIQCLVHFESDKRNEIIVYKRKQMWFYINNLKNDKFMKRFIIW